jgi:hypothetical protein
MKGDPDFRALPYIIGDGPFWGLFEVFPIVRAWCVRHWNVTVGVVTDTMLVPHTEMAVPFGAANPSAFVAETQTL